jgi:hypothetical protein
MTAKEEKQLKEIEWGLTTGTSHNVIAKKIGLTLGGFRHRYVSLRAKYLRKDHE